MESGKAEKLRRKIIGDAQAEAARIVDEGRAEATRIRDGAQAEVRKIASEYADKARAQAEEYKRRQLSLRELEARKAVLSEKGALIDQVFDKALEQLRERDRKDGYSLTSKLLLDAVETGDEEIVLSPDDKQNIGKAFLDGINERLRKAGKRGELKVSGETQPIKGGFILKRGRTEINASFDTLLAMLRDDMETEIAGILFGGGK